MNILPFPASTGGPLGPDGAKNGRKDIAVIGSGVSGLSAAWLLSKSQRVTLFEKDNRPGGHANTVDVQGIGPVDTGFIVYNEPNYPNLVALFEHLGVRTRATDMSFAVSLDNGHMEYAGTDLFTLFAQPSNLLRPAFWSMLSNLLRFYREAPAALANSPASEITLGDLLRLGGYSKHFIDMHLLPMAAAVWSTPGSDMLDYPAEPFIRFCDNHGLLRISDRPVWRTVEGGSRSYVQRLIADLGESVVLNTAVESIRRENGKVLLRDRSGRVHRFDHVVLATHTDQALDLLDDPSEAERQILSGINYQRNIALLHTDSSLMPRRRKVWSSWNYVGETERGLDAPVSVTYWMNRLQAFLPRETDLFVSLNPSRQPREGTVLRSFLYDHPVFDLTAAKAQRDIWTIQGERSTWFCGAWAGAGFHEDGLQAGLAVAEALGGVARPWQVDNPSGRLSLPRSWSTKSGSSVAA